MKELANYTRLLERWEETARKLGAARRLRLPSETRLDLSLAQQERSLVCHIYKDVFGHRIGYPKLPRPRIARR